MTLFWILELGDGRDCHVIGHAAPTTTTSLKIPHQDCPVSRRLFSQADLPKIDSRLLLWFEDLFLVVGFIFHWAVFRKHASATLCNDMIAHLFRNVVMVKSCRESWCYLVWKLANPSQVEVRVITWLHPSQNKPSAVSQHSYEMNWPNEWDLIDAKSHQVTLKRTEIITFP